MSDKVGGGRYTVGEEIANSITHGLGLLLAVAACSVLVVFAAQRGTAWHVVAVSIFGASLILLYAASTIYHAVTNRKAKEVLKYVDYSAIYVLIAGSYTPFTLVTMRGGWGWALFGIAWGLAIVGAVVEVVTRRRYKVLSLVFYLGMGWLIVVAVKPLFHSLGARGLWLLLGGGVAYTGGSLLYALGRFKYHHAIWHLLVLIGSVCHFLAVWYSVLPPSP